VRPYSYDDREGSAIDDTEVVGDEDTDAADTLIFSESPGFWTDTNDQTSSLLELRNKELGVKEQRETALRGEKDSSDKDEFRRHLKQMKEFDLPLKLPLIKAAMNASFYPLKLIASPWSAPAWMKTLKTKPNSTRTPQNEVEGGQNQGESRSLIGGHLRGKAGGAYHQAWARYLVDFLSFYESQGVPIWGLTCQNEPTQNVSWNSMLWGAVEERDFIKLDIGPLLSIVLPHIRLFILDDMKTSLPQWADIVFNDPEVSAYVSGVAVHWYFPDLHRGVRQTKDKYPEKIILNTEACNGVGRPPNRGPRLGVWSDGVAYAADILGSTREGLSGWMEWNMALNMEGGPNWASNLVDASILLDTQGGDVFFLQPSYFALAHFSHFIPPGSRYLTSTAYLYSKKTRSMTKRVIDGVNIETGAYLRADGIVVLILLNKRPHAIQYAIYRPGQGSES